MNPPRMRYSPAHGPYVVATTFSDGQTCVRFHSDRPAVRWFVRDKRLLDAIDDCLFWADFARLLYSVVTPARRAWLVRWYGTWVRE